nr:hypothetical protein CFP56_59851 [Quercus suber]
MTETCHAPTDQSSPPSRSFNARSEMLGHETSKEMNQAGKTDCSVEAPPLNQSNHTAFEEVLQNIDREIQRFDKADPTPQSSNGTFTASTFEDIHQPVVHLGPSDEDTKCQPMKPTPLGDITNMDLELMQRPAHSGGKWLRITRSAQLSENQPLNVSIGKRSSFEFEKSSFPTKRRALLGDKVDESHSQAAAAVIQPRRSQ